MTMLSPSTQTSGTADYTIFDTGTDLGREQLECLEVLFDEQSRAQLQAIGIRRGLRCLEIGAGTGSIARWMADRVRPDGRTLAIDIEPSRIAGGPGLEVRHHDINDGTPDGETFDIIHARLVLMHLRRRKEIVADLSKALKPGGWLVLGEFIGPMYDPIAAPDPADAELFRRVVSTTIEQVGVPGGISYEWAHQVDETCVNAGLVNVHSERHLESTAGGETGCILFANYFRQAAPHLLKCGISASELERFIALMLDPRFRAWIFEFTSVRAQKPG